jgi:hypothetical protein
MDGDVARNAGKKTRVDRTQGRIRIAMIIGANQVLPTPIGKERPGKRSGTMKL